MPVIGQLYSELLSGHSLLEYVAFAAVPLAWWVLFRTRFGLRLRAVGEAPAAVDTAGISVVRMRYTALIIGGLLAGIGGTYLAVAQTAQFIPNMSAGKGFMALAALVFGKWRPWNAMAACLLFGFLDAVAIRLQGGQYRRLPDPGAGHRGAALHPDGLPARRLHRQGGGAQGARHPLRQGAGIASRPYQMKKAHECGERRSLKRSRIAIYRKTGSIFTALGLDGLGRFSMNMTLMQPRNSANLRGVWAGDNAPAITAIWFAMN